MIGGFGIVRLMRVVIRNRDFDLVEIRIGELVESMYCMLVMFGWQGKTIY